MLSSADTTKKVMMYVRQSCVEDLDNQLKIMGLNWFDCRYSSGDTPLHVAAKLGKIGVVRYFLKSTLPCSNMVDIPNISGKTPLHEACQHAQPEIADYLLTKGANCRAIKQADWTPLMLACTRKGPKALECCQILLERGGVPLLKDQNKDGWNALHVAVREGDLDIVKALLEKDLSQAVVRSKNGRSPLHTAALHGCHGVVKILVDLEATDYNSRDSCGSTPLHDAVRSGSVETVTLLVQAGAHLNAVNDQGYGILHMVAEIGDCKMLKFLCEEFDIHNRVLDQQATSTPLHCAVRSGQVNAVETLLRYGANPAAKDAWGRLCRDLIPGKISEKDQTTLHQLLVPLSDSAWR